MTDESSQVATLAIDPDQKEIDRINRWLGVVHPAAQVEDKTARAGRLAMAEKLKDALPLQVAEFSARFESGSMYALRADRFYSYWRDCASDKELGEYEKAWKKIAGSACSDNDLILFFQSLPDAAIHNPHADDFGGSRGRMTIKGQRAKYQAMARHVDAMLTFFESSAETEPPKRTWLHLVGDVKATLIAAPNSNAGAFMRGAYERGTFYQDLKDLKTTLENADPAAKYLTAKPDASWAERTQYIAELARACRHLSKPNAPSVALLANVNYRLRNPVTAVNIKDALARLPVIA